MPLLHDDAASHIAALASTCATDLPARPASFHEDLSLFEHSFRQLLDAVTRADPRYAFDRDGRPAAVQAVRHALPAVEAELLDAIVEDVECEMAAVKEALYQIALALRR